MKLKTTLIGLALVAFAFAYQASAAVTPTAWYHFGEGGLAVQNDSTANNNTFNAVYFQCTAPLFGPNAVGGPLGASVYTSTNSARFGLNGCISELFRSGAFDGTNYYVPPATNFGVEFWFMPQNKGYVSDGSQSPFTPIFASGGSVFGAGPGGGVAVLVVDNFDGTSSLQAAVVHQGDSATAYAYFGPNIPIDTNNWIHLALVNDDGLLTFYTNGVVCATNDNAINPLTASAGTMGIGRDGGHVSIDGFLDEVRVFTFAPGAFTTNDLLFAHSPRVIGAPKDTTVWNGGAANISANVAVDTGNVFKWYQGTTEVAGQTEENLNLNTVALADSGKTYHSAVTNDGVGLVTADATLTVVPVKTDDTAAYQNAITGESGLLAYFTADGSTGATVANTVDGAHNGTLEGDALYDGATNRAFGVRAIYLRGKGDVRIENNASYEFSGTGSIEALVYLKATLNGNPATIFSVASEDGMSIRYAFAAAGDGSSLILTNDSGVSLTWPVPVSLLDRLAHVALVFNSASSVTAYADGQSLGTKTQTGFGSASGVPAFIGSMSTNSTALWNGALDEIAVYSSALSAPQIAIHNSKFIFGTNTSSPTIVGQSASKTVYAGGSPVLSVKVSGTPPFTYQWKSNGVAITGATNATLELSSVPTNSATPYTVLVGNPYGNTDNTATPIMLTVTEPPAGYASTVMADKPAAFWPMKESSGTTLMDYAGFNDGAYNASGVAYGAGGPSGDPGAGVQFDGAAGRAVVPYSPVLNPDGPFTIEFWAKLNAYNFYSPISSMVRPARSGGYEFYMAGNFNGYEFHTAAGGGYNMITGSGTAPTVGTWYHVAGVWDGTTLTLYVDGYPIGTDSAPPFVPNSSTAFYIGSRSDGAGHFNGAMADVAFYNYALTQEQIQGHVSTGLPLMVAIAPSPNVIADTKPSGEPHDALNNGATWVASSSDGTTTRTGVMQFTATNANSQVTDFGYSDFNTETGTIMFWMRSPGTAGGGNEGGILFDWRSSLGLALVHYDNGTIFVQAQNNWNHFNSTATVSDDKWHHIAITFDQTALGGVSMYVDGAFDSSAFNSQAWFWPVGQTMEIGRDTLYDGGYWRNYDGQMDDFRIYNRQLTEPEIAQAKGGAVVDASALTLRLDFDAPPGGYAVTWPYGSLQIAPDVLSSFTTVSNVTSPFPVAPKSAPQKFFRGVQ